MDTDNSSVVLRQVPGIALAPGVVDEPTFLAPTLTTGAISVIDISVSMQISLPEPVRLRKRSGPPRSAGSHVALQTEWFTYGHDLSMRDATVPLLSLSLKDRLLATVAATMGAMSLAMYVTSWGT